MFCTFRDTVVGDQRLQDSLAQERPCIAALLNVWQTSVLGLCSIDATHHDASSLHEIL